MENQELDRYLIPKNMKVKSYIFSGIGYIETAVIAAATLLGVGVSLLLKIFTTHFAIYIPIALFGLITLLMVREEPRTGTSPYHLLKRKRKFDQSQKTYYYK